MAIEHSDEELATLRAETLKEFRSDELTCEDCGAKKNCPYVFDPYNTHGDCLAEK